MLHLRWTLAKAQEGEAKSALATATALVGDRAAAQMNAAKEQAVGAHRLPELRDAEAQAAAAFQRLSIARAQIEEEAGRIRARQAEIEKRLLQLDADIAREEQMVRDNAETLQRLDCGRGRAERRECRGGGTGDQGPRGFRRSRRQGSP